MNEQLIESALRAGPTDEPRYDGDFASRLRARSMPPDGNDTRPSDVDLDVDVDVDVVELAPRRRRRVLAWCGAAAAAVVLVYALATVAPRDDDPATTTPTTEPPPSTTLPAPAATSYVGRWVGATPQSITTPNPASAAFVVLTEGDVALEHLAGGIVSDFTSRVTVTGSDRFQLTMSDQVGRCAAGGIGDYRWTLSPGGTRLTLDAISDECAGRADAFTGTWSRIACPARGRDCLGALEAGRAASVSFDPFGTGSFGQVSYQVTDGWSSTVDDGARLTVLPPGAGDSGIHGIYLYADAVATTECGAPGETPIDSIAATLSALPELSVTTSPTTVGGLDAQVIDIEAGDSLPCDGGQPLLTARDGAPTPWVLAIGGGRQMRMLLVTLPDDRTMAIVVASDRSSAEYGELLDSASAVIDSLVLSATPG